MSDIRLRQLERAFEEGQDGGTALVYIHELLRSHPDFDFFQADKHLPRSALLEAFSPDVTKSITLLDKSLGSDFKVIQPYQVICIFDERQYFIRQSWKSDSCLIVMILDLIPSKSIAPTLMLLANNEAGDKITARINEKLESGDLYA